MELHQLRYFVAVAHTGNFSRAAERCHVSQPALSEQILKLERRLGKPLLNRLGRRAVLTDAGRVLLDRATAILAAVEDAERRLTDEGLHGGRLSIGAIPTIAPYLLPAALEEFARRCPHVELTVQEDVTRNLLAGVVEGDLDLAIVALPISDDRLQAEPMLTEPLLVAMPHGHPLARRRQIHIRDLHEEPFILLNEMHCLGEQALSLCRAHDCQPRIACRSAQIATVQALIALGHGISLLPEMARRADQSHRLVYRALANGESRRTIAAVRHRHSYHSPAVECFLGRLRQLAQSLHSSVSERKRQRS